MKKPKILTIRKRLKQIPKWYYDYVGTINAEPVTHKGKIYPPETLLYGLSAASYRHGIYRVLSRAKGNSKFWDIKITLMYRKSGWNLFPLMGNKWKYIKAYSVAKWDDL